MVRYINDKQGSPITAVTTSQEGIIIHWSDHDTKLPLVQVAGFLNFRAGKTYPMRDLSEELEKSIFGEFSQYLTVTGDGCYVNKESLDLMGTIQQAIDNK